MLALLLAVVALCVALIVTGATMAPPDDAPITTATQTLGIALLVAGIVAVCVAPVLLLMGFFTSSRTRRACSSCSATTRAPCATKVSTGPTRSTPANAGSTVDVATGKPIAKSTKVSLRARTYNGEHLKVNDKCGNPIEIADVIVWRVENTAKALFDVDDYNTYVHTQSETALRHVATTYAYDQMPGEPEGEITLRSNIEEVSEALKEELAVRLEKAGVVIDDARLTHLAYAPEIAQAMLRRQQAEAVIAAREKIVQGAVEHGGHGAGRAVGEERGRLGRRAQGRHGVEPHGGALRRVRRAARAEHGNAVPVGRNAAARRHAPVPQLRWQAMAKRKQYPLRIDSEVWAGIERWAADDLRSVNAQVEFILRRALKDAGPPQGRRRPAAGHPGRTGDEEARRGVIGRGRMSVTFGQEKGRAVTPAPHSRSTTSSSFFARRSAGGVVPEPCTRPSLVSSFLRLRSSGMGLSASSMR